MVIRSPQLRHAPSDTKAAVEHFPVRARLDVLLVEDNRDAADSLAALIRLHGHSVRVVYDGANGLQAAQECVPDCVISDINMPGLDGYQLARAVRDDSTLAHVQLVALSAYSHPEHVSKTVEAGFDLRLTKPAAFEDIGEVLAVVERIKELAAETNSLAKENVTLAAETKGLLKEVKEELKEVKEEVRELKAEVQELKDG